MADRFAEADAVDVPDRQLGYLVIEIDETFDDDFSGTATSAFLGIAPGSIDIGLGPDGALAFTGRTHDGFHHAGYADVFHCIIKLFPAAGKLVWRGSQPEFFCRQSPDALTVHGEAGGPGGRDHGEAFALELHGDGLHEVR